MRKLWCFEIGKIGEKNLYGISLFLLENKWEGMGFLKKGRRGKTKRPNCPLLVSHLWTAWATRGQRISVHVWLTWSSRGHHAKAFWPFLPHAHPTRSLTVFGPPNSDFESVFGLQIMTPSRTTKTTKLWQKVENSSQMTMTKTTQRIRTQSSVATSFGLET